MLKNLDRLNDLKPMIDDDMVRQFNAVKRVKKEQLCERSGSGRAFA